MWITQQPAADPEHHWPVTQDDRLERGLIASRQKPLQKLRLAQPRHGSIH
jgi:hypothetical protein